MPATLATAAATKTELFFPLSASPATKHNGGVESEVVVDDNDVLPLHQSNMTAFR